MNVTRNSSALVLSSSRARTLSSQNLDLPSDENIDTYGIKVQKDAIKDFVSNNALRPVKTSLNS